MPHHNHKIVGLILAAGESKRMGTDKALLKLPNGKTLLEDQVLRLQSAGIDEIFAVVGCNAEKIISEHCSLNVSWVKNENWEMGSFSSVIAGLETIIPPLCKGRLGGVEKSTSPCPSLQRRGVILLPIDCVNVAVETVKEIIGEGCSKNCNVIPAFSGTGGHPVFLCAEFLRTILQAPVETSRLDEMLEKNAGNVYFEVKDKNILSNVNTLDDLQKPSN